MLLFRNAPSGSIVKADFSGMPDDTNKTREDGAQIVIKKYANRRLYNTESSTYVTLDDLAQMVRSDRDFVVRDAKSGDDLTHAVLTQIIVEQEGRAGGPNLLPIPFLRQLIRFYDDSVSRFVPSYLQASIEALAKEQERYRAQFANAWGATGVEAYQEQARKNLEMFEQAMAMWSPVKAMENMARFDSAGEADHAAGTHGGNGAGNGSATPPSSGGVSPEIESLKAELAAMQTRIEKLSQSEK